MTTPLPPDREFIDFQQAVAEAVESATRLADEMQIAAEADREVSAAIKKLR